ncbi:MAG: methyltransferase domain-containing protein [Acidobacteriota bacterium]|jgi:SAM-dependent methyltransferase
MSQESSQPVIRHYTVHDLGGKILAALKNAGVDLDNLTIEDLAAVDAFHIRGREATRELAGLARLADGDTVLDAGCGIGGTSRYLAAACGCRVSGVDLTGEYVDVARMLTERVGLSDRVDFQQGSVLDLPFEDGCFDVVWTEHAQMNIADKPAFYRELFRVLKPGGKLAFHDIFAGPGGELRYPVPWAPDDTISHLVSIEDLRGALAAAGFSQLVWEDKTAVSAAFFQTMLQRGPAAVGLHLLMDDAKNRFANMVPNLAEGRICVVQAVMRKGAGA